jgi:hypothetical protein
VCNALRNAGEGVSFDGLLLKDSRVVGGGFRRNRAASRRPAHRHPALLDCQRAESMSRDDFQTLAAGFSATAWAVRQQVDERIKAQLA